MSIQKEWAGLGRFLRENSGSPDTEISAYQEVRVESGEGTLGGDNNLRKHLEAKENTTFLGKYSSQWLDHRSNSRIGCFRLS